MIPVPNSESLKVSIIMPTYNRATYIVETIESIRAQTHTNWELLIMDDGSTDITEDIIKQFDDQRIQFYKLGRIGVNSKVKNAGLKLSKGEYIAFIDSDDIWQPKKLELQIAALDQYPDACFCVTNGYNFTIAEKPIEYFYPDRTGLKYGDLFLPFCKGEVAAFIQVLMLRKNCLNSEKYFDESEDFNDFGFIGNLAYSTKGIVLFEPLLARRIHNDNHSKAFSFSIQPVFKKTINRFRLDGKLSSAIANEIFFKSYIHTGEYCIKHGKRNSAIANSLKAWKYKPLSIIPLKKIIKALVRL